MTDLTVALNTFHMRPVQTATKARKSSVGQWQKFLLACGIMSSLLYIAMNVFVPMFYPGYSVVTQTVSELSAIGAPTRMLWFVPGILYSLLIVAFGWGVYSSSDQSRYLRLAGTLMIISGLLSFTWTPMHQRAVLAAGGGNFSDTWHIAMSFITLLLMLSMIGLGAAALKGTFRTYSMLTIAVFVVFGVLTWLESPGISTNGPTPMIGVWERINIGVYMLWVLVFATILLRRSTQVPLKIQSTVASSRIMEKSNGHRQPKIRHKV